MAYRFTNTDKWSDNWFSNLEQIQMLLFIYLCDNCDIAGFIEVNFKRFASDLNSSKETIIGALKGLDRGLTFSEDGTRIYINNFLKHQKNLPLNGSNKAHVGIIRKFEQFSFCADLEQINNFIEAPIKPLVRGTGIGNGNSIIIPKTKKITFEEYKSELLDAFKKTYEDQDWIKKQQRLNPGLHIQLSLEKAVSNYWGLEAGWVNKKKEHTELKDWRSTFANALKYSKVYLTKEQKEKL